MIDLQQNTSDQWYNKVSLHSRWFAIYGLGKTGLSTIDHFKEFGFQNYTIWDDKKNLQLQYNLNKKNFMKSLDFVDYIVISPGIDINNAKLKKKLQKNKHKLITDLDLFYLMNPKVKTIVITGTNGKSTTCKIIEHFLKKNKIDVKIGGNIGSPILKVKPKKNSIIVIEASSFQLAYSKFIKPTYAMLLNISQDHLDWHKKFKNYVDAKFKIFSLQDSKNFAFITEGQLVKKFKKRKNKSILKIVKQNDYFKIKHKIKNKYLNSKINEKNMSFAYELSKILKISENSFTKAFSSFKGLSHRYEIFKTYKNAEFINDSKATSFEASKHALKSNNNIYWIVGGLPKTGDKFNFTNEKKNIIKAFIIGKNPNFFKKNLKNKINYKFSRSIKNALISIFDELKKKPKIKSTILFSPASASYDQFTNFEERGNQFKKLVKFYGNRFY